MFGIDQRKLSRRLVIALLFVYQSAADVFARLHGNYPGAPSADCPFDRNPD